MPFIYGSNYSLAVLADTNSTVTCVAADSCKDLEDFFRTETVIMGYVLLGRSINSRVSSTGGAGKASQKTLPPIKVQ